MTSFFPIAAANMVSADTLLTLWEALSILGFWAGIRTQRRRYFISMWFFLGAAFLTKGPPGLIPLLWILPMYGLIRWKGRRSASIFSFTGMLLFIATAFGWYFYEAWFHPGLLSHWVKHEVAGHLLTSEFARNTKWYKAILIYWPVLTLGSLPWIGVLFWKWKVLPWPRGNWFHLDFWTYRIEWSFIALSIVLPLVLFSLSKSKLPLYILPLFISISLALGKGLYWLVSNQAVKLSFLNGITVFTLIIIVAAKMVASDISSSKNMEPLAQEIMSEVVPFPQRHLYFVGDDPLFYPLYGLEFYLKTLFIRVSLSEPAPVSTIPLRDFLDGLSGDLSSGIVPFILVREQDLLRLPHIIERMKIQERVGEESGKVEGRDSENERGYVKRLDSQWVLVCLKGGN
jgi:4-amino-4-deoxy-L-arabinose transferase